VPRLFLSCVLAFAVVVPAATRGADPPPAASPAAEAPKAVLRGPASVAVDSEFWLKFQGSRGDSVDLELASGPEPVDPVVLYGKDGTPTYGVASAATPGAYVFVVVASSPGPDGKLARAYAFWTVTVGGTPGPDPIPPLPPAPVDPNDPRALARQWPAALAGTFADSFAAAATDVRLGTKAMADIKAEHVARWKAARDAAFNKRFVPLMDAIIPPATATPTIEQRRRYAEFMDQIVQGTREGTK
jgi:hypothetical protein